MTTTTSTTGTVNTKRDEVSKKIKALMGKTVENGCSEEEAMAAANMIGRLSRDYDISITEVEFKTSSFVKHVIKTKSRIAGPMQQMVVAIANFTGTSSWFSRNDVIEYTFFGSEQDTLVADYMYHLLETAIASELARYKKSTEYKNSPVAGKTKTTSFLMGMTNRLRFRLNEMIESINKITDGVTSTSLMPLNKIVIVKNELDKLNMGLKTVKTTRKIKSVNAYVSGQISGNRVNITSGISAKSTKVVGMIG